MTAPRCPHCGAPTPADAPEGLCPRCLLKAAVQEPGGDPVAAGSVLRYVGDYEILEEIARGGMGVVFRARQVTLNRIIALKMILSGGFAGPSEVARFLAEAEAAASLQHPGIVAIHEVGRHGDQHYFSMDLVEGTDLGRLAAGGPVEPVRAARYVLGTAEAIQYAHQRGTLHRDLKPQNVLIDAADRPRITDFGLARPIDRAGAGLTTTGTVMGSPGYMPPEQAQGRLDLLAPASDVYSIGAILYHLLTGRAPFEGASLAETLHRSILEPPVPPSRRNPLVPADLETICLKCLEKSPERRYPTARALAEDLRRFLGGEPILARPASRPRRAVAWCARHPWAICALLVTASLLTAGLAYGLWQENAHLRWVAAHPAYVRAPGERLARAQEMSDYATLVLIAMFFVTFDVSLRQRGRNWNVPLHRGALALDVGSPFHPLSPTACRVYGVLGALGIAFTGLLAARWIEAWVWESMDSIADPVVLVYATGWFACRLAWVSAREARGTFAGPAPVALAGRAPPATRFQVDATRFLGTVVLQAAALAAVGTQLDAEQRPSAAIEYALGWWLPPALYLAVRSPRRGRLALVALVAAVSIGFHWAMPAPAGSDWTDLVWFVGLVVSGLLTKYWIRPAPSAAGTST